MPALRRSRLPLMRRPWLLLSLTGCLVLALGAGGALVLPRITHGSPTTYTVSDCSQYGHSGDSGGTLYDAYTAANVAPGGNTIKFTCGGTPTITIPSPLIIGNDTPMIFDGSAANVTLSGGGTTHIMQALGNLTLIHLTIADSFVKGMSGTPGTGQNAPNFGLAGAIYITDASAVITDCTFTQNETVGGYGGSGVASGGTDNAGGPGGNGGPAKGAAIYFTDSSHSHTVTVTGSAFDHNAALGGNGGAGGDGGAGTVNVGTSGGAGGDGADALGAAIFDDGGSVSVTQSTFTSNLAEGGMGGAGGIGGTQEGAGNGGNGGRGGDAEGGAIAVANSGTVTVADSTFDTNIATGYVGGAGGAGGAGAAPGNGGAGGIGGTGYGGAIRNEAATVVTVTGSTFTTNFADGWGGGDGGVGGGGTNSGNGGNGGNGGDAEGGAVNSLGTLNATNDTFARNGAFGRDGGAGGAAGSAGGGVAGAPGSAGVAGNGDGGGIETRSGTLTLTNVTINGNHADSGYAGGYSTGHAASFPSGGIANSIIAGNTGAGDSDCYIDGGGATINSNGHNLSGDATCNFGQPTDQANANPLLGALASNGGPTQTMALLTGSPAIDTGGTSANGCPATDQRGAPRPQGAACDIGAFEVAPSTTTTLTASPALIAQGQNVQLCATVAGVAGTLTPTGTVTFKEGSTTLGSASLSGGKACVNLTTLAVGTHSITASYGGDTTFGASTSAPQTVTVGVPGEDVAGGSAPPSSGGQASGSTSGTSANGASDGSAISGSGASGQPQAAGGHAPASPAAAGIAWWWVLIGVLVLLVGLGGLGVLIVRLQRGPAAPRR